VLWEGFSFNELELGLFFVRFSYEFTAAEPT
jgi:hypothetical protein